MAIESVLKQANLKAKDIDLIIGHGASTVKGDSAEIKAYHRIFGDSKMPPIVFHKWLTGHTLGAAGGTSIALAIKHLKSNLISPHPYFQEIDDDNRKRHRPVIERVLVVSLGFGGNAAAIILSLS
jgi:3-oxoacyl-[acyl-carrier-protein] synthase II